MKNLKSSSTIAFLLFFTIHIQGQKKIESIIKNEFNITVDQKGNGDFKTIQ